MSSLFSLYHSVRTLPMWQDIWFINCYFVIGFRWKDDGKQVIASQAGSTVSTPHPQNWSLIGSHRWRGGKLSHFDRSFFCHNEMPTKLQRPDQTLKYKVRENAAICTFTSSFHFDGETHVIMKCRLKYRALGPWWTGQNGFADKFVYTGIFKF